MPSLSYGVLISLRRQSHLSRKTLHSGKSAWKHSAVLLVVHPYTMATMMENGQLLNYIGGKWKRSRANEFLDDGRNTPIPNYEHAIGKEGIITQVVELIF